MTIFKTIEEAREHFKDDKFASSNGIHIDELYEDRCICSMEIREDHRNAYGSVMGGATFTLGDFASAVVANNIHNLSVAQQVNINYLNAPKGSRLIAEAVCLKSGRRTAYIVIDITDDAGIHVAQLTATASKI